MGLILKAEHPPVLGGDGFCACDGESVVYSAQLDGSWPDAPKAQALSEGKELSTPLGLAAEFLV